jgi:hypothetical protein
MLEQLAIVTFLGAILSISLGLGDAHAAAQGHSAGKGGPKGRPAAVSTESPAGKKGGEILPASTPVFSTREVTIITDWFRTNRSNLPPGLAKRETLPPGLEKQLQKNGHLPPGLEKKYVALPIELERQLSPIPTGYRRVVIGGNVITMEPVTGVIYDIIRGVVN